MNKKLFAFFLAIIAMLMLTGCTPDFTSEEFQEFLIEANTDIDSYSLEMNMQSEVSTLINGEQTFIKSYIESTGAIDRDKRKMELSGTINTNQDGTKAEQELETYVVGGPIYTKNLDAWTKMDLEQEFWEEQDQMKQLTDLIKSGDIQALDDDKIGEDYYYVLRIIPDIDVLTEMIQKQQNINIQFSLEEVIKDYSATIWVNKQSFIIEKSLTEMLMEFDTDETGNKITMSSTVDLKISNMNEETNIELPTEAENAIDMTELLAQQ